MTGKHRATTFHPVFPGVAHAVRVVQKQVRNTNGRHSAYFCLAVRAVADRGASLHDMRACTHIHSAPSCPCGFATHCVSDRNASVRDALAPISDADSCSPGLAPHGAKRAGTSSCDAHPQTSGTPRRSLGVTTRYAPRIDASLCYTETQTNESPARSFGLAPPCAARKDTSLWDTRASQRCPF